MVRRSFAFAFADKATVVATAIATMAVLSRLLTPAEIGLFVVAATVVVLVEALRDFGIGAFLISERDLTTELARTAATLIALLSLLLGGITVLAAPQIAEFYGDPALVTMIRIAAISFLLAPVGTPLLALLRRDMRFGAVAAINVAAGVGNAGVAITLALAGVGPMSLVAGTVASAAITAAGAAAFRPEWQIFRPSLRGWRRVLPFGAWSSIVTVLGLLLDALPRLVLGRVLGFDAVGFYARAISVAQLPERLVLSAVQPVLLPALAGQARQGTALGSALMTGMSYVSGLQWPALAMIALLADPIVRILLGAQWLDVVPLVRIAAPVLAFLVPVYLCYPTLVALGRVRDMAAAMAVLVPPCFAILLAASTFGLEAMASALFLTGGLQALVLLVALRRRVEFGLGDLATRMLRSGGVTAAALVPAVAVLIGSGSGLTPGPLALVLSVAGAAAGWTMGVVALDHPLRAELRAAGRALRQVRAGWGRRASRSSG